MSGKDLDLRNIALDDAGRVVLSDDVLEQLNAAPLIVSAGGSNETCTNGSCGGSSNTISCSNTQCDGSTNKNYCLSGPIG
jgi:hypothetical protein